MKEEKKFYRLTLTAESGNGPEEGHGYFTKKGEKLPGSDFEVPEGADDLHVSGVIEDDEPYFTEIQFTIGGKKVGEPIRPPRGSKPDDLEVNASR